MGADAATGPITQLARLAGSVSLSTLDADRLADLLGDVRAAQAWLDALIVAIGVRADELTGGGQSRPSHELLLGDGRVRGRTARRDAARSEICRAAPSLGRALADGEVSGDHVDSIAGRYAGLDDDARSRLDLDALVHDARRLPADTFDRVARRAIADAGSGGRLADAEAKRDASTFRHWFDRSAGMGRFQGSLDPERYEALTNAIEARVRSLAATSSDRKTTKDANLAATALVDLATETAGSGSGSRSGPGRIPAMTIVVDRQALTSGRDVDDVGGPGDGFCRQTESGHDLTPEAVARLLCDSAIRRVLLDERNVPIAVGRTHRTATDAQWAAIKAVHDTCAWTGCERPIGWTQLHHIREWQRGGPTDLDNLVPLCSEHHHRVHEGRWSIRLLEDRSLEIRRPDGRVDSCSTPSRLTDHRSEARPERRERPVETVP